MLVYLVGNRADLEEEREVSAEDAQGMLHELGLDNHVETSALTGMNVHEMFETLTKHLYLENNSNLD